MLALNLPANKAGFASTTHNMLVLNLSLTSCCQWMYPHIMLALHRSTSHTDSPHVISECTTILCWHCTDLRVTLSCWHCTDLPVTLQCWIAQTSLSHYNAGLHRPTCHITMLDCTDLPVTLQCWIAQTYLSHYHVGLHRPTCHITMLDCTDLPVTLSCWHCTDLPVTWPVISLTYVSPSNDLHGWLGAKHQQSVN